MSQVVGWMMVVLLGGVPDGNLPEATPAARLQEAREDYDAAVKRRDAGEYAEARQRAEHALMLREAALGSAHAEVAAALDLAGDLARLQGELAQAEPLLQRARVLRETLLGKSHPDVALSLQHLGLLSLEQGLYARAEPLFLRARALREAALGKSHPDVAASLQGLAELYSAQGLYARAEPLYQQSLELREAALGDSHPDVAASLQGLAALYGAQGLYDPAEPLHERALMIREAALGNSHPDIATSLEGLAALHSAQGLYEQAEPLVQRALALREVSLGNKHPHFARSLLQLAVIYLDQGLYGRAEPLLQRALEIQEAALGKSHPDIATSLQYLATVYLEQGLYGRAQPLQERALTLREDVLGKDHPHVAASLHQLATIYLSQGLYDRAEPLLKRALASRETTLGDSHPDVAASLHQLATLYLAQGAYTRAEPLLLRALKIQAATLGEQHPAVATSLYDLASLYAGQGLYDLARPLHERALALREAALGAQHPDVATSLHALATLSLNQGLDDQAEQLLLRALALREEALGPHHPDVATTLGALARLRLAQNRLDDALPLHTRAFALSEQRLRQEALDFSEARLASFLHQLRSHEESLYALVRAHPEDARVRRLALSAVLLLKGRSLEETAHISRTLYQSLNAEDRDRLEKLRGLRALLASRSLAGPGALTAPVYQEQLKALTDAGDALEAELAQRSAPLRALTALPPPSEIVERVAAALPKDSALVEFVAFEEAPPIQPPGTSRRLKAQPLRYLALVLLPDASTQAVDLGLAAALDTAASRLRDALARRDPAFQTLAHALQRRIFQPLLPLLGATRRVLVSPEGSLGLVPLAALHDGQGFLVDSFDFTYLNSGRELLPRAQESTPSSFVFVLADPDFSASAAAVPPSLPPSNALERFFSSSGSRLLRGDFSALPGTRREAEGILSLLPQARVFLGAEATKERLLHLPTPGILHLATHGFFVGSTSSGEDTRVVGATDLPVAPEVPLQAPLLQSGLVLGGPSAADPSADAPRSDMLLVTALELAGLDLWGTQLVVLSACDTGRGEVHLGQGIYGLRRALVVAGAETVVMSLWSVNDDATRLLMDAYYRNLLAGQGRASALREAMRTLRATHPHPYYWAPFIALGSDAPLRAITPEAPVAPPPPAPTP